MVIFLLILACCNFLLILALGYFLNDRIQRVVEKKEEEIVAANREIKKVSEKVEDEKQQLYDSLFGIYDSLQREMRDKLEANSR